MTKQTSMRLPEEIIKEVEKLAKKTDRSNNYYYAKWIKEGLKKTKENQK